jgi:flagellar biosynthesis/type III secretory pathway chaperone
MQALSSRLDDYLNYLIQICATWSDWIAEQEQAVVKSDFHRLNHLTASADQLLVQIQGLHREREEILREAAEVGVRANTLKELAESLPSWSNPAARERLRTANRHIEHLRRLHLAIWVLISHCERFASQTIQIMSHGQLEASVYASTGRADTSGGQLLDTQA